MNIEELQAAVNRHNPLANPRYLDDLELFVDAARMWLNPNIEAAMEAYETHQPTTREWIAEAVAAALTRPGDTDE